MDPVVLAAFSDELQKLGGKGKLLGFLTKKKPGVSPFATGGKYRRGPGGLLPPSPKASAADIPRAHQRMRGLQVGRTQPSGLQLAAP